MEFNFSFLVVVCLSFVLFVFVVWFVIGWLGFVYLWFASLLVWFDLCVCRFVFRFWSLLFHVSFVCYACFALVRFARLGFVLYVIACSMLLCFGVGLLYRPRSSLLSASRSRFSPGPLSCVFCCVLRAFWL